MDYFFRALRTLFIILLASVAYSQQDAAKKTQEQPRATRDWKEVWRNATVAFGVIAPDQTLSQDYFQAIGTGVIVSVDLHNAYLVTARHMFCDPDKLFHPTVLQVRFAWQGHKSIYSYLGLPFTLRNNTGANLWRASEDGDIAAIQMPPIGSDLPVDDRLKSYDSVPVGDVSSDVYEGESVFVYGYPGIVGKEKLVKPILRQGIVAWTDPSRPDDRVFLVDANLYPGNSGGPVIKFPTGIRKDGSIDYLAGGKTQLLGIVSQVPVEDIKTVVPNSRLGQVETHTPVTGIGALGFIEPAVKIRKLIEMMQQGIAQPPTCDVPDPGHGVPK